jgi:hypothetical protein
MITLADSKKINQYKKPLCRFHKTPLDELWPGELLCETCLEADLMTPEEDETREDCAYYNSIKDSE